MRNRNLIVNGKERFKYIDNDCLFNPFGPFPRTKPPYGYFKLTTYGTDSTGEIPQGNVPVRPVYGNRGTSVPLVYSYDNIDWNLTTSDVTIYSSAKGELWLKCIQSGNRQVSNESPRCWVIGTSENDSYYKVEGDLKMLLDENFPADGTMGVYCFYNVFSDHTKYSSGATPYNRCLDANVIIPSASNGASQFGDVFGKYTYKCAVWKEGNWSTNTNAQREFDNTFQGYWSPTVSLLNELQINWKTWPSTAISSTYMGIWGAAGMTYYIPDELPALFATDRMKPGSNYVRFNVDEYGGGHE